MREREGTLVRTPDRDTVDDALAEKVSLAVNDRFAEAVGALFVAEFVLVTKQVAEGVAVAGAGRGMNGSSAAAH